MAFSGLNPMAVLAAALAGWGVGAIWYGLLFGKTWTAALGKSRQDVSPSALPFVVSLVASLVMAWVLAGVVGHLGEVTMRSGTISAAFLWVGFVATTIATNNAFQGARATLSLVDAGHYLAAMLVMGAVIGAFGV